MAAEATRHTTALLKARDTALRGRIPYAPSPYVCVHRHRTNRVVMRRRLRYVLVATLFLVAVSCAPRTPAPLGMFIEEFEGFPVYHRAPGRAYRVLGPVFSPEAAARGITPMKRAAVSAARRLGADAILLDDTLDDTEDTPDDGATPIGADGLFGTPAKWVRAVAIEVRD